MKKLNYLWINLTLILSRVINPLIMGIFFFVIFTPLSIFLKIFGRDELMINKKYVSLWKKKAKTSYDPKDLKNQF